MKPNRFGKMNVIAWIALMLFFWFVFWAIWLLWKLFINAAVNKPETVPTPKVVKVSQPKKQLPVIMIPRSKSELPNIATKPVISEILLTDWPKMVRREAIAAGMNREDADQAFRDATAMQYHYREIAWREKR